MSKMESKKLQTTLAQFDPTYWPYLDGPEAVQGFMGDLRHDARIAHEQREVIIQLMFAAEEFFNNHDCAPESQERITNEAQIVSALVAAISAAKKFLEG